MNDRVSQYQPAGAGTLQILGELIAQKRPIFAMPSWFISAESAQVGFLLSRAVNELLACAPAIARRTFFANSRFEALHGAIKLMRHSRLDSVAGHGGRVLVFDPAGADLRARFDPLEEGAERALVPGVTVLEDLAELRAQLAAGPVCGVVLRGVDELDPLVLVQLAADCRARGVRTAVDLADFDFTQPRSPALAAVRPDLVVFGESLTGYQVPFGAFTGTPEVFQAWSTPGTAFLHSNTYGGNSVAMAAVRAALLDRWPATHDVRRTVAAAQRDWRTVLRLYERHVNPGTVRLHRRLRGALHVVEADGARVTVRTDSGRRLDLVDGLCGAGLGVNGHNPADAITEVVARHDPQLDYVGELEQVLAKETGLPCLLPAVSGASAVETALTVGLLAQKQTGRRRIIVFRHNYGGKTLVSLLATAAERTRQPFGPLYQDIRYIDPYAETAVAELRRELASEQVALVWVELVHGSSDSFAPIPDALLKAVAEERETRGFLVGVDEILTSYYRCGRRFAHHGRLPEVDLLTLSKALSYGCFPIGVALVSEAVEAAARAANPELMTELTSRHANQLGAHFGLHAIAQVDRLGLPQRVAELSQEVADGIARMETRSATVGRRFAEGMLGRIEVRPPRLLRRFVKPDGELLTQAAMLWWITHARAFVVYDVFLLPLIADRREIRQVMSSAVELSRMSPYRVLLQVAGFLVRERVVGALRGKGER